jgi:formamidopyrimidine-DNA glycosylase
MIDGADDAIRARLEAFVLLRAGDRAGAGRIVEQAEKDRPALAGKMGDRTFSDFRDLTGTNGNYGGVALVYRRGGEPCRSCGTPIRREKLGGRSSHWCPSCQH